MRLLIFDLDHTLVHSNLNLQAMRRDIRARLAMLGIGTEQETDGLTASQLIALGEAWDREHGTVISPELWAIATAHELAAMDSVMAEPGTIPVLRELSARGYTLAVCTNNARVSAEKALAATHLAPYFALVWTREKMAGQLKPSGQAITQILLRTAPVWACMIGDSWVDGAAATAGGIPFIAFRCKKSDLAERKIAPWRYINDLAELLLLLP